MLSLRININKPTPANDKRAPIIDIDVEVVARLKLNTIFLI